MMTIWKQPKESPVDNSTGLPFKFHKQDCHSFYLIKCYHTLYTAIKHYKNLQTPAENNLISSDKL